MTFDPTLSFGAILNAAVLLVGFVVAFTRIGGRIDLLAQRFDAFKEKFSEIEKKIDQSSDHDKRVAILEERVTNHVRMLTTAQRDISDLRRGEGFITGHRKSVDGEYS